METSQALPALIADPAAFLDDEDAHLRRLAVTALRGSTASDRWSKRLISMLRDDPDEEVRAAAASALAAGGAAAAEALLEAADGASVRVAECAVTALGEIGGAPAVDRLVEMAQSHDDRLVRESAVASLGEIADDRALPVLLDLVATGPPQVRRRAVVALTAFDGEAVEAAFAAAREDRNPMVREAAEMVIGIEVPDLPPCLPLLSIPESDGA